MNLNTWRMQFLTSTYFWSCRKVSISTSPRRRIVAQSWVWRVSSKTRSVQGHPEEHLPPPPTPSLVVLWGLGIAIYCEFDSACVALELIDLLTFEKIREKCIKDAHCFICIFIYFINEICADSKFIAYLKPFVVYCNMFWKWQCFWEWV